MKPMDGGIQGLQLDKLVCKCRAFVDKAVYTFAEHFYVAFCILNYICDAQIASVDMRGSMCAGASESRL